MVRVVLLLCVLLGIHLVRVEAKALGVHRDLDVDDVGDDDEEEEEFGNDDERRRIRKPDRLLARRHLPPSAGAERKARLLRESRALSSEGTWWSGPPRLSSWVSRGRTPHAAWLEV
jgi:hypothetical protein